MKLIQTITIVGFLVTTVAAQEHAAQGERSFANGFAQNSSGNLYTIFNRTGAGARDQDKDIDFGDGPLRGEIIGLTPAEKASEKTAFIYIQPPKKVNKGTAGKPEPLKPKK